MSSERYACDLRIDRRLRRILVAGGLAAWLTGCLLVLALPAAMPFKAALIGLWSAACSLELGELALAMTRIDRIRITANGEVWGIAPDGARQALEVLPGSAVFAGGAWLRLRFADGRRSGEWLVPQSAGREPWRLLQLLWRQRGGSFGRLPRS